MEDNLPILGHVDRELPVKLDNDGMLRAGHDLAAAQNELQTFNEQERKAVLANLKSKETEIRSRISKLVLAVTQGTVVRNVRCVELCDVRNGRVFVIREDTNERVGDRALRDDERQLKVPGTIEPAPADEEPSEEHVAGTARVIRARCGHLVQDPEDGTIPTQCKACKHIHQDDGIVTPFTPVDHMDTPPKEGETEREALGLPPEEPTEPEGEGEDGPEEPA